MVDEVAGGERGSCSDSDEWMQVLWYTLKMNLILGVAVLFWLILAVVALVGILKVLDIDLTSSLSYFADFFGFSAGKLRLAAVAAIILIVLIYFTFIKNIESLGTLAAQSFCVNDYALSHRRYLPVLHAIRDAATLLRARGYAKVDLMTISLGAILAYDAWFPRKWVSTTVRRQRRFGWGRERRQPTNRGTRPCCAEIRNSDRFPGCLTGHPRADPSTPDRCGDPFPRNGALPEIAAREGAKIDHWITLGFPVAMMRLLYPGYFARRSNGGLRADMLINIWIKGDPIGSPIDGLFGMFDNCAHNFKQWEFIPTSARYLKQGGLFRSRVDNHCLYWDDHDPGAMTCFDSLIRIGWLGDVMRKW